LEFGELKPILTTLAMPPASFLLLAFFGWLIGFGRKALGAFIVLLSIAGLWLVSCNAVAVWLSHTLLPQYAVVVPQDLKAKGVQAIIVLGAGVQANAPEYGQPVPQPLMAQRLRYGAWLAHQTRLPLGYTGGVGWANVGAGVPPEAVVARRVAQEEHGITLRWAEDKARDTAENGVLMAALLKRDGIRHIALVTHAFHMPRSLQAFRDTGIEVTPAPMGFIGPMDRPLLDWLPSAGGLGSSRLVLREWLGLQVLRVHEFQR
jgi:uncharacterized SAM-binding protein YcdF (DUF218 family)